VELRPGFGILHRCLTARLVRPGRLDEARASAARLKTLDLPFTLNRWSATVGISPIISDLTSAMRLAADLPERHPRGSACLGLSDHPAREDLVSHADKSRIVWLSAERLTPSFTAARVKLRSRATSRKAPN
jgi:hypothetical protein